MAAIAILTAAKVEVVESIDQMTVPCAVAVTAGMGIQLNTAGKWILAKATTAALSSGSYIATRSAVIGEALTGLRQGVMDGFVFTQAYNAQIFLSDTDGVLQDSTGTVGIVVGRIIPGWSQPLGTAADKLLYVNCPAA